MQEGLMYIAGQWSAGEANQFHDAMDPAKGTAFARVAWGGREDARRAIAAANEALVSWRKVPLWERAALCRRMAEVIDARRDELADVLCQELGKPRHGEALDEAGETSVPYRQAAELAPYMEGSTLSAQDGRKRIVTLRQERGVVAVVTPWNFPAAIAGEYIPMAIVMGNTVVWTPAPTAAMTAVKLMACMVEAGLPPGVVNLVIGPGQEVGDELVVHPGTHAVGMTGSPATGKIIRARAGLKPTLMELGGNGPTVILDDVDPIQAARAVAPSCFYAAGQVCSSAERIFVARSIRDAFVNEMIAQAAQWEPGDPWLPQTRMGPQNNPGVVRKISAHVQDALARGAQLHCGGKTPDRPGYFYQPTVLTDFPIDAQVNREETFGPIAPITAFEEESSLWPWINACPFGLVSAVFTHDVDRAWRWAQALRSGITVVNDSSNYWEMHIPFGGMSGTDSGLGRIGGRHTLEFMSDLKTIVFHTRE